jgi:hypothetical protein
MSTRDYEEKIREELIRMCLFFLFLLTKQRLLKALEATVKVLKIDNNVSLL